MLPNRNILSVTSAVDCHDNLRRLCQLSLYYVCFCQRINRPPKFYVKNDIALFGHKMYCLQWLIPVLLIPKPVNPTLLQTHVMFMVLYLTGFFLERKPCTICSVVFLAAVFLICYSGVGCMFWSNNCDNVRCED